MMRQLLERLETTTKTGVTLRVLSGGKDPKGQTVATPPATPASPAQGMAAVIQGAAQQALPKAEAPERFYVDQNAGVPMAQTVERNGMRLHRFMSNLHVLDLANAGKRGKTVSSFTLSGFDPRNDGFASAKAVAILEAGLKAIAKAKGYAQAVQIARETAAQVREAESGKAAYADRVKFTEGSSRGVDVEPAQGAAGAQIKAETPTFTLEASLTDFSVAEKPRPGHGGDDTQIIMPPTYGAKKTAIKAFYLWVQANLSDIKRMTFRELYKALSDAKLAYHIFSTMD